ncbi:site-specific recombinase, phage integrase family [hydrothermal vent metagenome]|uniref:Site-specific recombinase, phage integrase family n=1 Tax=hydrothermal vent metagenome TaxID=652676 RepID=A0A1W1BQA8_9ZZZZ
MARIKSKKYNGVYLNHLASGDITYTVTYKDAFEKKVFCKIGKKSEGITEIYAYNKRNEFINKVRLGEDPIAHKKKKHIITLDQLAKVYFDDKRCMVCDNCKTFDKLSDSVKKTNNSLVCTYRKVKHQYNKYMKHLEPRFGKANVATMRKDDIQKLRQSLQAQEKSESTINGVTQLLSTIINYSIKQKELKLINPCVGISKLSTNNERERYLTTSEVKELLSHISDFRELLFVKLALSTGGRLQTILHIKKKDINLSRGSVLLMDLKNNSTYTGFLNDDVKAMLATHIKNLKADDYILSGKPTRLSDNAMARTIRPTLNRLFNTGLKRDDRKNRVVIHTFRHTFASHLAINGTPIFTIQKLMNHRDIKMTMRYAKLAPDSGMDMVKELYL